MSGAGFLTVSRAGISLLLLSTVAPACGYHYSYRILTDSVPTSRIRAEELEPIGTAKLNELVERIGVLAESFEMKQIVEYPGRPPTRVEEVVRDGLRQRAVFVGPYGEPGWLRHPGGGLVLHVWVAEDGSGLEISISDWRTVGRSERLDTLRDQVIEALKAELPDRRIRVEQGRALISP